MPRLEREIEMEIHLYSDAEWTTLFFLNHALAELRSVRYHAQRLEYDRCNISLLNAIMALDSAIEWFANAAAREDAA